MAIAVSIISNSHIASKAMHVASYFMIIVVACLISININIMIASAKTLCHSPHKTLRTYSLLLQRKPSVIQIMHRIMACEVYY